MMAQATSAEESVSPGDVWVKAQPKAVGLDEAQLHKACDYASTAGGSGYITRHGKLAMSWGDAKQRYDLKSTTKCFDATALGLAVLDGKIALTDLAKQHHPDFGM